MPQNRQTLINGLFSYLFQVSLCQDTNRLITRVQQVWVRIKALQKIFESDYTLLSRCRKESQGNRAEIII